MIEALAVVVALSIIATTIIGVQRGWFSGIPYQADNPDWYMSTTTEFCPLVHRHLWIDGREVSVVGDYAVWAYNCPACQNMEREEGVIYRDNWPL
jgi:hypothetical protein